MSMTHTTLDGPEPVPSANTMARRRTLAAEVKQRRSELGLSQVALSKKGLVSLATIGAVERGERRFYQGTTLANLDKALGWPRNTAQQLLDEEHGADERPAATSVDFTAALEDLAPKMAQMLREEFGARRDLNDELIIVLSALTDADQALILHLARRLLDGPSHRQS